MSHRWVALLRGVNVGGKHRLAMADVRSTLESMGLVDVRTHLQSGNVVFGVGADAVVADDAASLAGAIADVLGRQAGFGIPVVVRTVEELATLAESHPEATGDLSPKLLHVFVLDGPVVPSASPNAERFLPDRWELGDRAVFVTYPDGSARSKLTIDVFERAFGVMATARNLNTLRKIVDVG